MGTKLYVSHAKVWFPTFATGALFFLVDEGETYIAGVDHTQEEVRKAFQKAIHCPLTPNPKAILFQVLRSGKSLLVEGNDKNHTFSESVGLDCGDWNNDFSMLTCTSYIITPLLARGKVIGALMLGLSATKKHYNHESLTQAEDFACRLALAIDNSRLYWTACEAIHAREEFIAIASHELLTPLTPLILNIQLLKGMIKNIHPNYEKILTITSKQIERLGEMARDFFDVSILEKGRIKLHPKETDLRSIVETVVDSYESQTRLAGIQVDVHTSGPALGEWDPRRIEEVVENLVSNAIKYGEGKPIHIVLSQQGEYATLSIIDQGIGLQPSDYSRIFAPFSRAVEPGKIWGTGTGSLYCTENRSFARRHSPSGKYTWRWIYLCGCAPC